MRIFIVWDEKQKEIYHSLIEAAQEASRRCGLEPFLFPIKGKKEVDLYTYLKKEDPEYILSFDLAGFDQSTLQECSAYNLLYAKQMHVLFQDDIRCEQFFEKNQALNLFFFLLSKENLQEFQNKYPKILNLKEMKVPILRYHISENELEENTKILQEIIEYTRNETEIADL